MKKFALVNEDNKVINVIIWDGETPWCPPAGLRAIQDDNVKRWDVYDPVTQTFFQPKE